MQSFKTSSTTQCTFQKWPYQWWGVEFNLSDLECSVRRDTQCDAGLSRCAQPSPFMLCTHYIVQDCIYVFHIFSMFQYSMISASIFVYLFYLLSNFIYVLTLMSRMDGMWRFSISISSHIQPSTSSNDNTLKSHSRQYLSYVSMRGSAW